VTQPETTITVVRRDRWSLWPLAAALPAVIWLWWSIVCNAGLPTILLVLCANVVIFGAAVIAMLALLIMRRLRAALSALAAAAIIVGGFATRITILNAARYADFAMHRAGYERTVEAWRVKHSGTGPLRLVLHAVDQSELVVPTIFDYIVYDESDAVGRDPPSLSGNLPCATQGCGNGLINGGGGNFVVQPFGDHFYFVEQAL
jgi:hypothetical protein